ncbi:hypothetical protein RSOLAG22IIIB_11698 [Rhizoctonia solani]|uniref:Transcription factor domain-containing protein n=1 Tax=Rhizoctonia solani TaxID=456999 RepID=A0A0K6GA74_9AGAM|nr:hypothetical protein RSOLAG22IIIB_11698 [Rhizoctonia solani]
MLFANECCLLIHLQCSWVPEGDEDRPATKQLVEGLRAKIQFLEAEIAQLKQGATAITSSSSGGPSDAEFSYPAPQPTGPSGGVSHSDTSSSRVQYAFRDPSYQTSPQPHLPTQIHPAITSGPLPLSHIRTTSIDEPTPGPLNKSMDTSADRRPSLTYQYIFNIPLNEPSPEDRFSLRCEWDRHLPALGSIQLSRHEHDTLLFRCFSYGAAWLFGLIPDLFLRDMLEFLSPDSVCSPGELQYYSPLLHCSLLAFASPLSDNIVIQQITIREKFAIHAKQWLDEEFSYGNPSLALSLILLAEYHLGVGERNTGYMYTGAGSPLGDWHYWSAFVQERLLAHEMNRPSEMPVPTVSIELPVALELDGQPLVADSISNLFSHENYVGIGLECFVHCARLMLISITIVTALDGPTRENIHLQLETWFNALPGSLSVHQVETLTPPPILALHIHYWWSILRLYPSNSAGEPSQFTHHATEKLVELFRAFDTQFGFRYFPRNLLEAMYMCGRTLILERLSEDEIDVCMRGLRAWSCAQPMLRDLAQLKSLMEGVNGFGTPGE